MTMMKMNMKMMNMNMNLNMNNNNTMEEEKKEQEEQREMVVVTGYKRSGTSLMMALVEHLGVDLCYCEEFEAALKEHHGGKNDFYYEDAKLSAKKANGEVWCDGAVKMFSHVVTHNVKQAPPHLQSNVKVIWMKRDPALIERSIRRYKKPNTKYVGPGGHSSSTLEDELEIIAQLDEFHQEAQRELDLQTIQFEDLLQDPFQVAQMVADFLGRPYDSDKVHQYLKLVNTQRGNKENNKPTNSNSNISSNDSKHEETKTMS
ncbi:expressed unknown protein [Seminavis robusta]|uniref:Sulfotransferase domain-containing protein n=1 Tax=Seminavis robusta TaxID=568900 RepID=A0A9N8H4C6_9STRA|nr:expressed unknown protein [Seminavis robusta]|eukprot:Sro46_g027420.1 n/a (260) ;mRNA; r:63365-64144